MFFRSSEQEAWFTEKLDKLQQGVGYRFRDLRLLMTALTHSSYAYENGIPEDNERLEFLGDAVLQLVVSCYLYLLPDISDEGTLSQRRAFLVCEESLVSWARIIGLPPLLRRGRSVSQEEACGTMSADTAEALFGAVFLDGGYDAASALIEAYLRFQMQRAPLATQDPKSELQITVQQQGWDVPVYEVTRITDPPHAPVFDVRVLVADSPLGEGRGPSRKSAEFNAARKAMEYLAAKDEGA